MAEAKQYTRTNILDVVAIVAEQTADVVVTALETAAKQEIITPEMYLVIANIYITELQKREKIIAQHVDLCLTSTN